MNVRAIKDINIETHFTLNKPNEDEEKKISNKI